MLPAATPLTVMVTLTRLTLRSCKKSLWSHNPEKRRKNPQTYGNLQQQFHGRCPQEPAKAAGTGQGNRNLWRCRIVGCGATEVFWQRRKHTNQQH